ncbi:MAG: DUF1015 family protein [Deltaproteobacteria bacterium]|nr:MAG: DUF1015 family protein [Deltaproteobacteria bacterium]
MRILPYHRILKRFGKTDALLKTLSGPLRVEPSTRPVLPSSPGTFGLFAGGKWHVLTPREPKAFDDGKELDCDFLQKRVFGPLYGIDDPRTDPRLDFVGGSLGPDELVRQAAEGALFTLAPVSIGQVMQVADSGGVMPPKSTWFHPKLLSGLVVRSARGG